MTVIHVSEVAVGSSRGRRTWLLGTHRELFLVLLDLDHRLAGESWHTWSHLLSLTGLAVEIKLDSRSTTLVTCLELLILECGDIEHFMITIHSSDHAGIY